MFLFAPLKLIWWNTLLQLLGVDKLKSIISVFPSNVTWCCLLFVRVGGWETTKDPHLPQNKNSEPKRTPNQFLTFSSFSLCVREYFIRQKQLQCPLWNCGQHYLKKPLKELWLLVKKIWIKIFARILFIIFNVIQLVLYDRLLKWGKSLEHVLMVSHVSLLRWKSVFIFSYCWLFAMF